MKKYTKGLTLTAGLAVLLGAVFSYSVWNQKQTESPHYVDRACGVCHATGSPNCTPTNCFTCHVASDAALFANLKAPELTLCTSCHDQEGEITVPNAEGKEIKINLGISHPWGLVPSEAAMPNTLPLVDGTLTCQTCHDVHSTNEESRMLRLGIDSDFTPLCLDCHSTY